MTEMVVVDGVRVRADELDAYSAAASSGEVRYVQDDLVECPRCGSSLGVVVGGTWGSSERRLIDCQLCDRSSVVLPGAT